MILEWFFREGWIFLNWWLLVTLAGVAVLPLTLRLLGGLPDRGYIFARSIGLLLVGFVYWLLVSFGFLQNTSGDLVLVWILILMLSLAVYFYTGQRVNLRAWWHENRGVVVVAEILFFSLFLIWTIYRAHQNGLIFTEKPMEMAFLSSVIRSDTFPPNDPWMSGYAISYYYFGYVMGGILSKLSGIPSTIGFNMTNALLFALTGLNAFGVVYNLVRSRTRRAGQGRSYTAPILVGLLGMVFVVLLGNFQLPLIEAPYQARVASPDYLEFWGTQERDEYPESFIPAQDASPLSWSGWWWFRASRVLTDYDLDGSLSRGAQPIDEFPQFSFLLADNHPHVLALPFAMLSLGLALNILLSARPPNRYEILLYGVTIGGLVFLNTWDGPLYMLALLGAEMLRRLIQQAGKIGWSDWIAVLRFGVILGGITIVAYLPFFIGFRSQAAGILPNVIHPTAFQRFFIMFGPFIALLAPFLLIEIWRGRRERAMNWWLGLRVTGAIFLILLLLGGILILLSSFVPQLQGSASAFIEQNGGLGAVIPLLLERRIEFGFTTLFLVLGLIIVVARLFPKLQQQKPKQNHEVRFPYTPEAGFVFMLIGMGILLTLTPEFFYLRDNFGTRVNTIFKFYYQAWVVFSLAGAYAVYSLLIARDVPRPHGLLRIGYGVLLVAVLVMGLAYPYYGMQHRMFVETGRSFALESVPLTLDGGGGMIAPEDYAVVQCLSAIVDDDAVVAEAVRDEYNASYGRVGAITGIPNVLGWENHERQWRGTTYPEIAGTRRQDMEALYTELRWNVALDIINRYEIDFILFGSTERAQYGSSGEEKFIENLNVVCEAGSSKIYQVDADVVVQIP